MTREFSKWEVDPFFPAAEEVQDSADRLESAYRTWIHVKSLTVEADEDSAIQFRRRELCTALGTAKWQLEEFDRAVSGLVAGDQRLVGEDAPGRHKQFIDAIWGQINSIEEALMASEDIRDLEALPAVKLDQEEKDDLAQFLSGPRLREGDKERDLLRDFPVDQKADEEATSSSSGLMDSKCGVSHKCFTSVSSSDIILPKADIMKPDSLLRAREAKSSDNNCFDRFAIRDKLALDFFEIRTEQSDLAVLDPASAHFLLECRIRTDGDRDGNQTEKMTGQRRSASVGTGLSSWKNGYVFNGTKTGECGHVENGASTQSLWSFLKKKQHALALTISKSGFKRWKDGDANSRDLKGVPFFQNLIRGTGDVEKGNCSIWVRGNCLTACGSGGTVNGEDKQYKGWIDTFQSLQRSQPTLPSSRPVQVASALLAALGLVGLLSFHVTASSL